MLAAGWRSPGLKMLDIYNCDYVIVSRYVDVSNTITDPSIPQYIHSYGYHLLWIYWVQVSYHIQVTFEAFVFSEISKKPKASYLKINSCWLPFYENRTYDAVYVNRYKRSVSPHMLMINWLTMPGVWFYSV